MESLTAFWARTKPHMVWVVTVSVTVLYFAAWLLHYFTKLDWLASTLSQAATAVLVSGVFASLLKSYQFSELFKDELRNFFNEKDMIKKLREIVVFGRTGDDVIHKAMEHSLNVHCPELSTKFAKSAAMLLRAKHEYSHRNFVREITLVDYDSETGKVTLRDNVSCALLVTSNTSFVSSHTGHGFGNGQTVIAKLTLAEDGAQPKCMKTLAQFNGDSLRAEFPLQVGVGYRFNRVLDQVFELRKDPVIQQQFVRFCDDMVLKVINQVPDKLDFTVTFLNFAEQIKPETLASRDNESIQKTYTIDHLTFPYQGYIVTLTPI